MPTGVEYIYILFWGVNMFEQIVVFSVIAFTLVMFINGRLRYEFVSMLSLLI